MRSHEGMRAFGLASTAIMCKPARGLGAASPCAKTGSEPGGPLLNVAVGRVLLKKAVEPLGRR